MVARFRPPAGDRIRRARPRLLPARAVRKRGRDGPRGVAQAGRRRAARSSGSSANIASAMRAAARRRAVTGDLHAERTAASAPTVRLPDEPVKEPGLGSLLGPRCDLERGDDRFDHVAVRAFAALHVDVRLGIGRAAVLREPLQGPLRIAIAEQRPGVAPRRAVGQHVDRRVEPDGDRPLVEQLARARVDEQRRRRWR